ncbi:hypothetical protein [Pseudoflavitalea rhizosphaerae]|uniref:hypothetical protein n=1 Tax=Pseudoflavitalea rhizosphaerae TaxID=1884793 RepID=UPI000F8DBA0E|nr:hypothetical protein [Pseudoflavitalea rhizosphaerae]
MPTTSQLEISKLSLDLKNFRTVPQKNEKEAINAMISIKADRFFAVMESIIDDGYLPTENIIILQEGTKNVVKEGNRRIAALKIIHGLYKVGDFNLPSSIVESITKLDAAWKKDNLKVPCTIFTAKEVEKADRVVTLAHGKGEKASRDPWNSVARARHNRDVKGVTESGLDLLEKYLKKGNNLNNQQKDRWGGEYPLTVLDEAMRKIYPRLGFQNAGDIAKKYPQIPKLAEVEDILRDIGLEQISFQLIRNPKDDFPTGFGIPPLPTPGRTTTGGASTGGASNSGTSSANANTGTAGTGAGTGASTGTGTNTPGSTSGNAGTSSTGSASGSRAHAANDPKHVAGLLKKFSPRGNNRQKVVTLRDEIKKLKIGDNPIAFCFLLRSMFEISAKAYCGDHSISTTKNGGKDKTLVELLRAVTAHLTNNNANSAMVKTLHGAMTEIGKPDGILSVTSMNQLVHNPSFSVLPGDICTLFGNIYLLLEAMN